MATLGAAPRTGAFGDGTRLSTARTWDELLEADRRHVWHPYGPIPSKSDALAVVSAEGVRLRLADGRELVDGWPLGGVRSTVTATPSWTRRSQTSSDGWLT
jgi:hypothetical protein